jgi:integrase
MVLVSAEGIMGKLTALKVGRITKPGLHSDGSGLYLQVTPNGTRSWIFRYQINGRARYMGLGSASAIPLARARELTVEPRRLCAEKIDPLETRRAQRLETAPAVTFREVAEDYLKAHEATWNAVHRRQWRSTLEAAVYPAIGDTPVKDVDTPAVMKVLRPLWNSTPETASRIRGRIETILSAAKATGLRTGENPAAWRGHLQNLLPKPRAVKKVEHHKALPYRGLPDFMALLRGRPSISARALEFTILTATRRSEVLGARWDEVNFEERVWTIPASRMKGRKEHRVPLSDAALSLLRHLYEVRSNEYVFPGQTAQRLSDASMLKLLEIMGRRDLTIHGFRSTFRDWAAEQTSYPSDVVEMALAHLVGSAVERAYRRGDLFEKRARLMAAWSDYCAQAPTSSVVVPIRK